MPPAETTVLVIMVLVHTPANVCLGGPGPTVKQVSMVFSSRGVRGHCFRPSLVHIFRAQIL